MAPWPEGFEAGRALAMAIAHHHAGHLAEAETLYRAVLAASAPSPAASYGFGLLCSAQGKTHEAIAAYRDAIAFDPGFVEAHINLGSAILACGQHEDAAALFRKAISLSPANAMAHGNLGKALQDLGRMDEAIGMYRIALGHQPDNAAVHANLGGALMEHGAWDESVNASRRAIALQPSNAMAHANLGTTLLKLGQYDEALAACRQAATLFPDNAAIHATLGGVMLELGASQEAASACRDAIALDPTLPNAHFNLSHALKTMNRLPDAAASARHAIALCPDDAKYHFHLAHVLLLMGDLEAGWQEYEWRLKLPDFAWIDRLLGPRAPPAWAGEEIDGKTILVYTEQGIGDILQFARYLPMLAHRAGHVIVAAHPPLRELLETIDGVTVVSILDAPLPDYDVHCPLLSLPQAFGTRLDSIPAPSAYLRADPVRQAHWANRIGGDSLRVGIIWAGNPATLRDRFRSPHLASVAPLFAIPGIDFVVLQVGTGREDRAANPLPPHVLDFGEDIACLGDTAAIMAGLDLVISSCTGPLHLAGALGVPAWAMIPFAPHFPWLLSRADTDWYPSMRLYRQDRHGQDWSTTIARMSDDLAALAQSPPRRRRNFLTAPNLPVSMPTAIPQDCAANDMDAEPPMSIQFASAREIQGFNELAQCRSGLMLFNRNDIYIGASLRKYGEFSIGENAVFRILVQPAMTVLDIGANIGVHTVDLSRMVGPAGIVHAFEPQRLMYQVLCANIALNSCANVFTHQAAVGSECGALLVPFINPDAADNYGGLPLLGATQGETVPLITIDSLNLSACHVMKLDVEGMETEALRGAQATIGRCRPLMYLENDRADRSVELIGLLQSFNYRLYWHLPPLYGPNNFRADQENIFGGTISVNMLGIPAEIPQEALTILREVTGPNDQWQLSATA